MDSFLRILFSSLETGSFYALAALGIIIIFRTSVIQNFSIGAIGMFNAFIATYILMEWGVPTWVAAIIAMLVAIIVGIVIDFAIMRPSKKVTRINKEIMTLGLIIIFIGISPMIFGVLPLKFGRFIEGSMKILGIHVDYNTILNISIGIIVMVLFVLFLQKTKCGLAVRVTASNETAARLMGVPSKNITTAAWAVGAALSTLAALMLAPRITVNTAMMNGVQVNALIACVLGGFQTFYGPVIGAYVISLGRNVLIYYLPHLGIEWLDSSWADPILYLLILLFIVIRPNGIIGKKIIKKV
ncbi:branched-chain amino acid ABC transporter permease [Mycoplasmatota bacterium]|nr:branched-chain amino acid ABC transporter permease [Mycoplasmatota bacterium]